MDKKELYVDRYQLKENEYLLKIREDNYYSDNVNTGFMTKFNKDGSIPVAFSGWTSNTIYNLELQKNEDIKCNLPIYIHKEDYASGWELLSWRFGMSQQWARVKHPDGFAIEIYLSNFLDIVKENVIKNGRIIGKFKWEKNKLISE